MRTRNLCCICAILLALALSNAAAVAADGPTSLAVWKVESAFQHFAFRSPQPLFFAPGQIVIISGRGFCDIVLDYREVGFLPTSACGTVVVLNDTPLPILWVSPGGVSVVLPQELLGEARENHWRIARGGEEVDLPPFRAGANPWFWAPNGIYIETGRGTVLNDREDYARPGDELLLYATGIMGELSVEIEGLRIPVTVEPSQWPGIQAVRFSLPVVLGNRVLVKFRLGEYSAGLSLSTTAGSQ